VGRHLWHNQQRIEQTGAPSPVERDASPAKGNQLAAGREPDALTL